MEPIDYELHEEDLVAFGLLNLRLSSIHAKWLRRRLILLGVMAASSWAVFTFALGRPNVGLVFLGTGVLLMFLLPRIHWLLMPRTIRRFVRSSGSRTTVGPQRLALDDEGLHWVHPQRESRVAWTGVYRLVSAGEYILIYIDASLAFVVPKRVLSDVGQTAFRRRLESLSGKTFEESPL